MEERIGHYRILSRLGFGGMGEVFLAHDEQLDRKVAVKRIRQDAARPHQRERFRREARLAARLNHSNIVHVYDLLSGEDTDHLVLEYVEGTTLRSLVRHHPLPISRVIDLGIQIVRGLHEAHSRGIVHRDLKTENVLVTDAGQAKIADFGIAKLMTDEGLDEDSLTRTGAVLGTYRAMSPEQARGEPVDHRSDLFSFGVLLYELLTGLSPFDAENGLAMLDRIVNHRQPPLNGQRPKVPEELSALVDQLLEKDPSLRPRSAGEVARILEEIGGGAGSTASRESTILEQPLVRPGTTSERLPARHRRVLATASLILAVAVGLSLYFALRDPRPPLYVAVLRPEAGAKDGDLALLAAGVRVALLQGLVRLEGISPQAFEEVDDVSGSPREVAKAVAADELVGSKLDCRSEICRVTLLRQRGTDGSVLWAESFDVPTDDSAVAASAVRSYIRKGYSDHETRRGLADPKVSERDLDELLRLQIRYQARLDPTQKTVIEALEALRRRSPRFLDAILLEARALRRRYWASREPADLERALRLVEEARRLAPEDPRCLFERVDLALVAGKLDLAEHSLEELSAIVPGDARLLERRARLLEDRGEKRQALALMREAARRQPSARRLHILAQMEFREGEVDAARQTLQSLLDRSPGSVDGLSLLANIELSMGNEDRAIQLYSQLVRTSPGPAELSNLALAYLFLGSFGKAEEIYRRVLQSDPKNPSFTLNLADSLLLMGRKGEAEALYRRVISLIEADPTAVGPQFLTVQAQALAHLGEGPRAVTAVQEALRLAPNQGTVTFEAALVYALLGEDDSALANVERAIRQGIAARWFSLPWFDPIQNRSDFLGLLREARPALL